VNGEAFLQPGATWEAVGAAVGQGLHGRGRTPGSRRVAAMIALRHADRRPVLEEWSAAVISGPWVPPPDEAPDHDGRGGGLRGQPLVPPLAGSDAWPRLTRIRRRPAFVRLARPSLARRYGRKGGRPDGQRAGRVRVTRTGR
jgi:hypothetical protein